MSVAVAEPQDVAEDGDGGCGARVCRSALEPGFWVVEAFGEEVAENRVEVVDDVFEDSDAVVRGAGLGVGDVFAADVGFHVFGEMSVVGGHEVIVEGHGVGHEFDDAGCGG